VFESLRLLPKLSVSTHSQPVKSLLFESEELEVNDGFACACGMHQTDF